MMAIQSKKAPTDPITLNAYNSHFQTAKNDHYEYACDLAQELEDRDVLVAFFLSGADHEEISKSLRIPIPVLEIFEKLVIDLSVFRNKLEMFRYAQHYRSSATEKGSQLVELGVVQGPFALMHHFLHGHEELPVDAKMYARAMMQQAFYFGMLSRGNTIKSSVTKESLRWLSTTASLLKDYDRILGDSHDSDEALLEIEKRKMTQTPLELGTVVDEILH
jgi:hypothetical protein